MLLVSASLLAVPPAIPRIVIDGRFDDWTSTAVAVRDAPDDGAHVAVDFRAIRVAVDNRFVHLLLDFARPVNPHGLHGSAMFLFDADGDQQTGRTVQSVPGVDLIVDLSPPDPTATRVDDRGMAIRAFPPGEGVAENVRKYTAYDVGFSFAPGYSASRIEFRIERGPRLAGMRPLFTGSRFSARLVSLDVHGEMEDETATFAVLLPPFAETATSSPVESAKSGSAEADDRVDPLARPPDTSFRVLAWNVSRRAIMDHPQIFVRTLAAAHPDVILLDEVADTSSASHMQRFLAPLGGAGEKDWNVIFGGGGGYQRAVIASLHPVGPVASLQRLRYTQRQRELLLRLVDATRREGLSKSLDEDIGAVGASVAIAGRSLLMVPVDLQCCGNRPEGAEDRRRVIEATAIKAAIKQAIAQRRFDGIVIGGDLNLIGSREPLDVLLDGGDLDGSNLGLADALQLDGLSSVTWWAGNDRFAPGRLDHILYSDSSLRLLRAFVLDSSDVSPRWLRHHGLEASDSAQASDHMPVVADFRWRR